MSVPGLAIPAAPSMGHAAASKRSAANTDADFAAILDDTAPATAPVRTAAPAKRETEAAADPAPASAEDVAVEAVTDAAPVAPETPVAIPVSPIVSTPSAAAAAPVADDAMLASPVPSTSPATPGIEGALEASTPVPSENLVPTLPRPDARPEAALASGPATEDSTPATTLADLPDVAAGQMEQAKAAVATPAPAPAASATVAAAVASLTPRPAKPAVEDPVAAEAVPAEEVPASAPLEAKAAPVDEPRVRDVIERARSGRAEGQAAPADREASPASDAPEGAAPAAATLTGLARPAPAAAPVAAAILVSADADAAVATPLAPTTTPTEARPAEAAASLALSTISHAAIETTARIAAQIVRKLEGRSSRFEMALTPEGLGNVDVSLDIDADGKLVARMAFDNPLAATELRGRADELRRQLQDAGFTVADDALSFAERDASAGQQGGSAFDRRPDPRNARAFGAGARLSADADMAMQGRWIPLTLTPDRVDMKV
ncbi:flagellar hook-length control protein FliK [Brevundimonas sp.]|uniref:flagellar hook-length control protein FliK n=1 Tax=Brevundimonas sp. TaxID=1871086 RepID=UPI003D15063B